MAFLGGTFDATQVQPGGQSDVIPAGDYKVMISDSEMVQTKSGSGSFLKLTLQVIDGPHQGAVIFDRLNLVNTNLKAVEIAQRTLSAICHAIGVLQVQDSAQLHNRPLLARVAYREAQGEYGASNEIKGYRPISGGAPAMAPTTGLVAPAPAYQPPAHPAAVQGVAAYSQATAAPAPAAGTPPWMAGQAA